MKRTSWAVAALGLCISINTYAAESSWIPVHGGSRKAQTGNDSWQSELSDWKPRIQTVSGEQPAADSATADAQLDKIAPPPIEPTHSGTVPEYQSGTIDQYLNASPEPMAMPYTATDCLGCDSDSCDGCGVGGEGCDGDCLLLSDKPLLHFLRDKEIGSTGMKYSVGGELRYRYMNERNRLRPAGNTTRNTYDLWRFTPFMQVGNDWIKGYVQAIDAVSFGEELAPVPIDENRWDLLQYYIDAKLLELEGGDVRGQVGRIFLKYGDQHLISPLGWSNTFRNFEGGKVYYTGENWNIDGFAVRPNNGAASGSTHQPESFDSPDQSVLFSGVYATYKKAKHGTIDLFWLWNNEDEPFMNRQDGDRHTFGGRYAGAIPVKDGETTLRTYNWDVLGGFQVGDDDFMGSVDQDVQAAFLSAVAGVTYNDTPWTPSVKGVFWYGSGDDDPNDGDLQTVNTLYPLGHAYWGLIDNFNGANLVDYSLQASIKPAKKLTFLAAMHWFQKANENDFVYNIAGAPLGTNTSHDRHIGNELDLVMTYQASKNLQFQAGYFWFWYGDAISTTALRRDDAEQFYFMTTYGF